jgi:hypothetical protein
LKSNKVLKISINILFRKFQVPFLLLPLDQISSNCEYAILEENSSDHTEKNSMISGLNLSQCSLEYDEANELPMQSSISHENQVYLISQNEPLNSQPIEQNPAVVRKQKIIRHPKIFIGTLMILFVMEAGIGILVSQTIQKKGDKKILTITQGLLESIWMEE